MVNNPRWPHQCTIKRAGEVDPFSDTQTEDQVIYTGACRSYSRNVTKGTGEVITSARVLSIPMKMEDWEITPEAGDQVEVIIGTRAEHGEVVDYLQNNFGTEIGYRYVRN